MKKRYTLPDLPYSYKSLEPNISEEQLRVHHDKHHNAYVINSNSILEKLEKSREKNYDIDMTAASKALSFYIGGHELHSLFWLNISPKGGGEPKGALKKEIENEFGSFERFKKEFSGAAMVEGSGWAVLAYCHHTKRPLIMQIEKHNVNMIPGHKILLVLDMWEHAYYIDYKNEKSKYIDGFWKIVDWDEVGKRLDM